MAKRPVKKGSATKDSKTRKKGVAVKKVVKKMKPTKLVKMVKKKVASVTKAIIGKAKVKPVAKKKGKIVKNVAKKPVKKNVIEKKLKPKNKAVAKKLVAIKKPKKTSSIAKKVVTPIKKAKPAVVTVKKKEAPKPKANLQKVASTPKTAEKIKPVKNPPKNLEPIIIPPIVLPDEDYMNAEQCEHFRGMLLDWKKQLLEEMERTVHHMQDEAASFADPNDRATQEEEFSLELRARDRERKLIKKIEEALLRLDHNEYGYCEACGVEIGAQRLEARPTATLCIDCKTIEEIREKSTVS